MKVPNFESHASEEKNKTLGGVFFQPIKNGEGTVVGYKSSDPSRKSIRLTDDSLRPVEGSAYTVEIVEDTDPSDEMKGQYLVRIVKSIRALTADDIDQWKELDKHIDDAEVSKRQARQASQAKKNIDQVFQPDKESSGENPESKFGGGDISNTGFLDAIRKKIESDQEKFETNFKSWMFMQKDGSPLPGSEIEFGQKKALVELRTENLRQSIGKIVYIESQIDELNEYKNKLQSQFLEKNKVISEAELFAYRVIDERVLALKDLIKEEELSSPEAWYGSHLRTLKEYYRQFVGGKIVETPSIQEKAEKLTKRLLTGEVVFIHGHLGSGKTELAKYISKNYFNKDYHMISGSRHMSPSEIYGHDVLTTNQDKTDADLPLDKRVEARLREWERDNKSVLDAMDPNEREGEKNRVQERIIASLEQTATVSKFVLGPIYRAMEKGEPFIIDELNAIPHDILISLNDLLTKRVGDKVSVQQNGGTEITVQPGFCVIMTGNLNAGDLQKYVDRNELDPAFISRIHSEEYDYLPQRKEGVLAEADETDELFTLMLVMTMDRQANLKLPDGSLQKMWNLAEASRVFQDVFSGKQIGQDFYYQTSGVNASHRPELNTTVMSIRNLKRVFDAWRNDGFRYEIDNYLYENFVATSTDPNDRAYIYQILQRQFGFFKSDGWDQNPEYGNGERGLSSFNIVLPKNLSTTQISFKGPREVIDTVYGKKAPERKIWPNIDLKTEVEAEKVAEALASTQ